MGEDRLLKQARNGDRQALDALCRREWRPVYAIVFAAVHDRQEAEDLTQDVFVRALSATAGLMTTFWDQQSEIWVWVVQLKGMPAASEGKGSGTLSGVEINARTGKITGHLMTVD